MPANSPAPSARWRPAHAVKLNVLQQGPGQGHQPDARPVAEHGGSQGRHRQATRAARRKGTDEPRLGLTLAPANSVAGAGKDGVVVTEVAPKSAAAERGFKEGDVILEVAGKSVTNAGDVREAINAARTDNKNSVLMRVKSGGSSRFVAVPLGRKAERTLHARLRDGGCRRH